MSNPVILKMTASGDAIPKVQLLENSIESLGRKTKSVSTIMKGVLAAKFISQGVEAIKGGFAAMGREAGKYEDILKEIEGITQATSNSMKKMHTSIMDNSSATEHLGTKTAEAALNINKMGFNAEESAFVLEHSMNLATASIVDVSESARVALQTMKSFGLGLGDFEHIVNVIQSTVSGTSIDFLEYADAMKFVAPIATKMNTSIEETSALIGILGDVGLKGSIGGTALKNMFLNLLKPGETVEEMLGRMTGEGKGLIDILQAMTDEGMNINDFADTFNLRALSGALSISKLSDKTRELTDNLIEEKVTAKEVADVMRDSFIKQAEIMRNNLFNIGNEIMYVISTSDGFKDAFIEVNEILQDTRKWVMDNDELIIQWGKDLINLSSNVLKGVAVSLKFMLDNATALADILKVLVTLKMAKFGADLIVASGGLNKLGKAILASNPYLLGFASALTAITVAMDLYVEKVDKMVAKNDKLNQNNKENLQAQVNALREYSYILESYEKGVSDIKPKNLSYYGAGQTQAQAEKLKLIEAGNKIEAQFGLPSGFLDAVKDSATASKMSAHLIERYHELNAKNTDENTVAMDENTKAAEDLVSLLKSLNKGDKDKDSKTIDTGIQAWSEQFMKDLNAGINKRFLTFEESFVESGTGQLGLRTLSKTVNPADKSTTEYINQEGLDTIHFDLLGLGDHLMQMEVRDKLNLDTMTSNIDDLSGLFLELTNNIRLMRPTSNLPTGISTSSLVSPLTQVPFSGTSGTATEGGVVNFDVKLLPSMREIENMFREQEFAVNLKLAEFDQEKAEAFARELKLASDEMKFIDEQIEEAQKELDDLNEKSQLSLDTFAEAISTYGSIAMSVIEMIGDVYDAQFEREQAQFDKRFKDLNAEKQAAIAAHKDKANSIYLINREFAKKEADLKAQQEEADKAYRKRQKQAAIVTAIINTALAVTSAIANASSNAERIIMGILVGGLGAAQIGIIAAQNYRYGGEIDELGTMINGHGTGTSDSIPIMASAGEYMVKSKTVSALGGSRGVSRILDRELDRGSYTSNEGMTIYIENAWDNADKVRETYKEVYNERQRWY